MQLFYAPNIHKKTHTFTKEESIHCIKVLRKNIGDIINIVDGNGNFYITKLTVADPKACVVSIIDKKTQYGKRDYAIHMFVSPTKSRERFEWFLEKVTELGVDEVTPIICQNSERKNIKVERMRKVLIAAMKQSLKAYLPKINEAISWKEFMQKKQNGQCFIAHCGGGPRTLMQELIKPKQKVVILIGPEGDFSEKEVEDAIQIGFTPISLGVSRLRTETAAIASCHIVNLANS